MTADALSFGAAVAPADVHTVTWQNGKATAQAPGKVNLYFAVGPVKPNGYHNVASLYAAVDVLETVTISAADSPGIAQSMSVQPNSPVAELVAAGHFDPADVPLDTTNLAYRGAAAVLEAQGLGVQDVAVNLHIEKAVPVAGGMGGGSADAAAAMKAMNVYLVRSGCAPAELDLDTLLELGAPLGADVPFALLGGIAVGKGVGEKLTPVDLPAGFLPLPLTLVPSEQGLSTPAVFRELDAGREQGRYPAPGELAVPSQLLDVLADVTLQGAERLARLAPLLRNDLAAPARALHPGLNQLMAAAEAEGAVVFVSGSGPTAALVGYRPRPA